MQWVIVGIAIGVLPTYVLVEERAKKESAAGAAAAASSAAAAVYAAWSAAPKPACPVMTMPTVVAVAQSPHVPQRVAPPTQQKADEDDPRVLLPMINAMQGMMNGQGGQQPDINELMKNMPKK